MHASSRKSNALPMVNSQNSTYLAQGNLVSTSDDSLNVVCAAELSRLLATLSQITGRTETISMPKKALKSTIAW